MWHEARKQEKKIRQNLIDFRKRAERRRNFYERIKADPTQFIQIYGRKCKIHLDHLVAAAGDNPTIMMPWQGQSDNLIDRFDARAHLDFIPPISTTKPLEDISTEERQCNYERYRILAQNDFLGMSEDKYLHQLHLEEQSGVSAQFESDKVKKKGTGAAIGYTYDDNEPAPFSQTIANAIQPQEKDDSDDSDLDVDVAIDISKLETTQAHELNGCGRHYGMKSNDFYSYLTKDADEADALRIAKEEEAEKIMLSGRKSRRERRAEREKRCFSGRTLSPPSYAAKEEPDPRNTEEKEELDESRSPSPVNAGKITYITSFGGEDELQPHSKISINLNLSTQSLGPSMSNSASNRNSISYAEKVKENLEKLKKMNNFIEKKPVQYHRRSSRSRSRSVNRKRRSKSRSTNGHSSTMKRRRSRSTSKTKRSTRSRSNRRRRSTSSSSSTTSSSSSSNSSSSGNSRSRRRKKSASPKPRKYSSSSSSSASSRRTRTRTRTRSRSKSPVGPTLIKVEVLEKMVVVQEPVLKKAEEPPPIKKYYGRKKENDSSTENDSSEDEPMETEPSEDQPTTSNNQTSSVFGKESTTNDSKMGSFDPKPKFNPRDRLKKKMQTLLNKQFKADKLAEIERTERQVQQQQEREDEMRELALKLRRRQRELRHKYGSPSSSQSDSPKSSDKNSRDSQSKNKSKSRSRSKSVKRPRSRSVNRARSPKRSRSPKKTARRSVSRSRNNDRRVRQSSRDLNRRDRHSRSRDRISRSRCQNSRSRDHRSGSRNRRRTRSRDRRSRSKNRRSRSKNRRSRSRNRQTVNSRRDTNMSPRSVRKLVDY